MLPKGMDMIRAALRAHELPIILADNVAEYVACREEKESIRFSELPSAPPPFANCFIEWKSPSTQRHYDGTLLTAVESPELQQGCSVIRISPDDAPLDVFNLTDSERVSLNAVFFGFDFATRRENGMVLPLGEFYLLYDADRRLLRAPLWLYGGEHIVGEHYVPIIVVAMTFAFMACKNMKMVDATASEGPPPKWCRRQRVPELRYHTIQLDPDDNRDRPSAERKTVGDRSGKALHICRGHFARFVDDGVSRGLFGRNQFGTFWVPSHTRGSLEHGRIVSTYNVKAPCNS